MRKASDEAGRIARCINTFLNEYMPSQKSCSSHTLKSYSDALSMYIGFLESGKGVHTTNLCVGFFGRNYVEEWLNWLMDKRGCSPETCNNRLTSLRHS